MLRSRVYLVVVGLAVGSVASCDQIPQVGEAADPDAAELQAALNLSVELEPDGKYGVLYAGIGTLAVTFDSARTVSNGSLLFLSIGNPLAADLSSFSATVKWGTIDARRESHYEADQKRDGLIAQSLPGGRWTRATFLVPDRFPSQIGVIEISHASVGTIELKQ